MSPFWLSSGGGSHVTSSCVAVGPWTATLRGAAVGTGGERGPECAGAPREEARGPETPDPLLQGFSGQGRAGLGGGGWKRSGAHLPPRQRPRAGGWRAPRPPRCTRSCGSRSAGACSGLGATVGQGRDRAHVTEGGGCGALRRRTRASLGPGVQAQERTGESWGAGAAGTAGDALAHPWDPAQAATILDAFRTERGTANMHAETTGANPNSPGHAGSQATSSLPSRAP